MRAHLTQARTSLLLYHCDGTELVLLHPNMNVTIGREAPCDIEIRDRGLSRHHARVTTTDDGIWVEDLGSTNGTFVNGQKVERSQVKFGDQVALGSVAMVLQAHGECGDHSLKLESHDRFTRRLEDEITRSRAFGRPFALLMVQGVRTPASRWARRVLSHVRTVDRAALWAPDCVEILLPEADRRLTDGRVSAILGDKGQKLRCGVVVFPEDAASVNGLLEQCRKSMQSDRRSAGTSDREPTVYGKAMRELLTEADRIARSNLSVLLLGETGVGKEVTARYIHSQSPRAGGKLVPINCGAIPANLVESTLFGHERGAFTGANEGKKGVLEEAHGGTIFLDEIGELPAEAQAALLRALDTKHIVRVGGTHEIGVDVRVLAATNRDLEQMCEEGRFREDLLFRVNGTILTIPPLRERRDDIDSLVEGFVSTAAHDNGQPKPEISPEAMELLRRHTWPGNIRELKNAIERAVVICRDKLITVDDLPEKVRGRVGGDSHGKIPISVSRKGLSNSSLG
ncbi:sigma 54-interacting transcriptional regulator [Myxococcota bacterium]